MNFVLTRTIFDFNDTTTFGELTCNGIHVGYTLEDQVRLDGSYVYSKTAIPTGKYKLITSWSNRFKREMIQVVNLPKGLIQFGKRPIDICGIRVHGGNTNADTEGCILVGKMMDRKAQRIWNCAGVNEELIRMVKSGNTIGMVTLEIVDNTPGMIA